jgi:hypothetical protein
VLLGTTEVDDRGAEPLTRVLPADRDFQHGFTFGAVNRGVSAPHRRNDTAEKCNTCLVGREPALVGERETVYTCTYSDGAGTSSGAFKQHTSSCFAVVEGRVYAVSVDPC